jgi:hypothetical protein
MKCNGTHSTYLMSVHHPWIRVEGSGIHELEMQVHDSRHARRWEPIVLNCLDDGCRLDDARIKFK